MTRAAMVALETQAVRGRGYPGPIVIALALLAVLMNSLMSGCTTVAPRQAVPLPGNLAELEDWQARGRIGVTGAAGGGSGSFDWQQSGDRAEVQLRGPVGIGSLHMRVSGSASAPELELETGEASSNRRRPGMHWRLAWAPFCRPAICASGCWASPRRVSTAGSNRAPMVW